MALLVVMVLMDELVSAGMTERMAVWVEKPTLAVMVALEQVVWMVALDLMAEMELQE
jgi:hypothetical protein